VNDAAKKYAIIQLFKLSVSAFGTLLSRLGDNALHLSSTSICTRLYIINRIYSPLQVIFSYGVVALYVIGKA
jgi:hypothetical protein